MPRTTTRRVVRVAMAGAVVLISVAAGLLHIAFGLANLQPGFPLPEAVTAIVAGSALLLAPVVALQSRHRALLTAFLGTLPPVAWFAYAVPVEGSSDPVFFWASLVIPVATGSALVRRRMRRAGRTEG